MDFKVLGITTSIDAENSTFAVSGWFMYAESHMWSLFKVLGITT